MANKKASGGPDKIDRFDERINRLVQKKQEYIELWEKRKARQVPILQKAISKGMTYISNRLALAKKWESKKQMMEERLKVLALQVQDRRKIIQTAQEKLREYDTCEPGKANPSNPKEDNLDE